MKIKLEDKYKSLFPFESEELAKFTIITGKNGSGKSQLLELMEKKQDNDKLLLTTRLSIVPPVSTLQLEGIQKDSTSIIGYTQWKKIIEERYLAFKALSPNARTLFNYIIEQGLENAANKDKRNQTLSTEKDYVELVNKVHLELMQPQTHEIIRSNTRREANVLKRIFTKQNQGVFKMLKEICEYRQKTEDQVTHVDFYNSPISEYLIDENDLFNSQVELIFFNYAKRRDLNRKNWFYKNDEGDINDSVPDKDFITIHIPPWVIINDILERHKIDFVFKDIPTKEFNIDVPLDFQLRKKSTDELIAFHELSSGEKVIIGLIIKLFTSEYYGEKLNFPELLLLDEPDAHLHPEMSKLLIDVINKTFVEKYGLSVIITTHNPSTIALASESSIYKISNGPKTALKKSTKDEALQLLTSFIPTLSIDYKNHKQIFVESPTDRFYYQTIFDRINQDLSYPFKLYFISNGYGKGHCEYVIRTVGSMRESGNKTCFGVIDWDKKEWDVDHDVIKVHGANSRYSIENYVYDPIYILILFLEMEAHSIHSELGLEITYNAYHLKGDSALVNKAIEWFFSRIYNKHNYSEEHKNLKRKVKYMCGLEVEIPIWYLEFNGHDLELRLKGVFNALQKFTSEGELQKKLTITAAKNFPLIHQDTVDLIESLMATSTK